MLPLLLLAAAVAPGTGNLLRSGDYPGWAQAHERSAAAMVRLLVAPDGRIANCETLSTAGDANLAAEACRKVRGRHTTPGRLADGSGAWSRVTTMIRFYLPGGPDEAVGTMGPSPDVELSVRRLPGGAGSADVGVVLTLDAAGAVTGCNGDPALAASPALVSAVCASGARLGAAAITDDTGHPVAGVTRLLVRLTAAG